MSRALGTCASKLCHLCILEVAISASLKRLDFKELRKHQELALVLSMAMTSLLVCLLEAVSLSVTGRSKLPSTLYVIELTPLACHDCIFTA